MRERLKGLRDSRPGVPSEGTLVCLALCALILGFATADLLHTESRLPDAGAAPLQDEFDSRAWVYSLAMLAIAALAVAYRLYATQRNEWIRIFINLGVTGVLLGIGAVVLLLITDGSSVGPPPAPTLLIPVVLVLAATAGTLFGRSERWGEQTSGNGIREIVIQAGKLAVDIGTRGQIRRARIEELARWLSLLTLGLTALTCLLAFLFVVAQPSCDRGVSPPGWTNPVASVAAVTAIGAMAAAVGALLLRRWIAALVGLLVCPVAVLFVLASTCAFY